WLAIGAPGEDISTTQNAGSVFYVLGDDPSTGVDQNVDGVSGGAEAGDRFGSTLAGDSNFLVVGTPNENLGGYDSAGYVHVFEHGLTETNDPDRVARQVVAFHENTAGVSGSVETGDEFGE